MEPMITFWGRGGRVVPVMKLFCLGGTWTPCLDCGAEIALRRARELKKQSDKKLGLNARGEMGSKTRLWHGES